MEQQNKVEYYRKQANKYADLAKSAELDFLNEFFRKTAVRYVLMAEDLERWSEPLRSGSGQDGASLWDRAEQFLAETRRA